jgi:hypothetical protein
VGDTMAIRIPALERIALAALAERQGRPESELLTELVRGAVARELASGKKSTVLANQAPKAAKP